MAVYKANLKALRNQINQSQERIKKAITHAEQRLKDARYAKAGTPESAERESNQETLQDAKRVLRALDISFAELQHACCQNDLNCDPEVLGSALRMRPVKKGQRKGRR